MSKFKTHVIKLKEPEKFSIKYALHKRMAGWDKARDHETIHASDLTHPIREFCPRSFALMSKLDKDGKDNFISTSLRSVFHLGRSLQQELTDTWIADLVVGDWFCIHCEGIHEFCHCPKSCPYCGKTVFYHIETRWTSDYSGASCGIDMLLDFPGRKKLVPVEVKTMDKDEFKGLMAPKSEHKWRTNLYLRILSESLDPNAKQISHKKAKLLYIVKSGYGVYDKLAKDWGLVDGDYSPFLEFPVKRDDEQTNTVVGYSRMLHMYKQGKASLPMGICPTTICKRAKACSVVSECFSGDYT